MNRRDFLKTSAALGSALSLGLPEPTIFSTGLPSLNKMMRGGIRPGEFCLVVGNRSGKTAFCRSVDAANLEIPAVPNSPFDILMMGSNDLLQLSQDKRFFLPDYEATLVIDKIVDGKLVKLEKWEQLGETISLFKKIAVDYNRAIIWTIPTSSTMENIPTEVDYFVVCEESSVNLVKNHHNDGVGTIPITFTGLPCIMRERS
jgi:TAT (twin-arginine translocation) pathway signal sequence